MSWNTLPTEHRDELKQRLSQRQLDVLILWLAGCSYDRISTMLGISVRSVRTHLKRARQVHNQVKQAAA